MADILDGRAPWLFLRTSFPTGNDSTIVAIPVRPLHFAFRIPHVPAAGNLANLANTDTPGYKAVRLELEELPATPGGAAGVRITRSRLDMTLGSPVSSDNALDLYIDGEGFLPIESIGTDPEPSIFSRACRLRLNDERELVTMSGHRITPRIVAPAGICGIMVEDDGVYTMPWTATIPYRPNLGPWSEVICAENLQWYPGKNSEVPEADKPDF